MLDDEYISIYLSLGSNIGDRKEHLDAAKEMLPPHVVVAEESSIYETEPWGYTDQPDFLNQVIGGHTSLEPKELLAYLKDIEKRMGRRKTFKFGPRIIDIDILFYGQEMYRDHDLVIPHPRLLERAFVLVPLAEIAPELVHPAHQREIQALLSDVDQSGVRKVAP
jgi:2-amino-4-hydroxy-6-hydroxymethyldihydropteridine diphosphokinase